MSALKCLFIFYNSFSLRLTENFTNTNIFSKYVLHVLFILFFCKMYNKKLLLSTGRSRYIRLFVLDLSVIAIRFSVIMPTTGDLHRRYMLFVGSDNTRTTLTYFFSMEDIEYRKNSMLLCSTLISLQNSICFSFLG